jgi:perosamine synthetase
MLSFPRSPDPSRPPLASSLPTLDPALLLPTLSPSRLPGYPLDRLGGANAHLFYMARAGVYHAIRHLVGDGLVLMPAYHHTVEVEAVRAAGAQVAFYRVDGEMRIDLEDLEQKMRTRNPRLVYLIHYVGFAHPVREIAELCSRRGVAFFEDCALSLFSRTPEGTPLGTFGDASVFCFYKSLPVPNGGLLLGTLPTPDPISPPLGATLRHAGSLVLTHLEIRGGLFGRSLRHFAHSTVRKTLGRRHEHVPTGSDHLAERDLTLGASRITERLLRRFDAELVVRRRRRNFQRLAEALSGCLPLIGHPLPLGACPLFLPVRVDDKPRAIEKLRQQGIEAVNFWSSGDPACNIDEFPEVARLRREVLEIPCHQSLDDEAIDEIASAVRTLRRA